jgi:arylsulfatase A-like enzyme
MIRETRYKKQLSLGLFDEKYRLSNPAYTPWNEIPEEEKADEICRMEVYAAMIDRMDQTLAGF